MCRLSWNLGASASWNTLGLSRPVMGLLYLYIHVYICRHKSCLCAQQESSHEPQFACCIKANQLVTLHSTKSTYRIKGLGISKAFVIARTHGCDHLLSWWWFLMRAGTSSQVMLLLTDVSFGLLALLLTESRQMCSFCSSTKQRKCRTIFLRVCW